MDLVHRVLLLYSEQRLVYVIIQQLRMAAVHVNSPFDRRFDRPFTNDVSASPIFQASEAMGFSAILRDFGGGMSAPAIQYRRENLSTLSRVR